MIIQEIFRVFEMRTAMNKFDHSSYTIYVFFLHESFQMNYINFYDYLLHHETISIQNNIVIAVIMPK